jgi:protein O-mannosyl-transferase
MPSYGSRAVNLRQHLLRKPQLLAAAAAFLVTLLVYSRALFCGFVNLDDPFFVVNNPFIRSFDSSFFSFAFSSRTLDLWMPLTWISFALDYRLWGLDPFGYHLSNIVLHSANSALVALVTARLLEFLQTSEKMETASPTLSSRRFFIPIFAALLFSLHPLRVESVAWVTERKDVLNGLFTLGALLCYLRYARNCGRGNYVASVALFACSLMAKPVSVVLPVILLVLDFCPLGRFAGQRLGQLVMEKAPFFLLSLASGLVTLFFFSQRQLLLGLGKLSLPDRAFLSGSAVFEYLRLLLYPAGISPFYEMPDAITMLHMARTAAVAVLLLLALFSAARRAWLPTAALCFVIPLVPTLSFFQNNEVALAARYTYLPSVAPAVIAATGFVAGHDMLRNRFPAARSAAVIAAVLLLVCHAGITLRLIAVWQNTETLWTRVISLDPATNKYMDRGVYYLINNRAAEAEGDFTSAIAWLEKRGKKPDHNAYAFRGVALLDQGRFGPGLRDFDTALKLKEHPTYHYYRGLLLQKLGRKAEAEKELALAGPNPPAIDTF